MRKLLRNYAQDYLFLAVQLAYFVLWSLIWLINFAIISFATLQPSQRDCTEANWRSMLEILIEPQRTIDRWRAGTPHAKAIPPKDTEDGFAS